MITQDQHSWALATFLALSTSLCACHTPIEGASPRQLPAQAWSDATLTRRLPEPKSPPREPSTFVSADDCERDARMWIDVDANEAWSRLIGCTTRRDFAYLRRLLRAPWIEVVRTRNDAALVLAKVIATRGGNVDDDLVLLRHARIPMFPFASALAAPSVYSGRLLLVRGRMVEGRASARGTEIHVEETVRVAQLYARGVIEDEQFVDEARSGRDLNDLSHPVRHRDARGKRTRTERVRYDVEHHSRETGRELIAKMRVADPFLVEGQDFVFLVRFDRSAPGVGDAEGDLDERGLGTIVAFYEAALVRVD